MDILQKLSSLSARLNARRLGVRGSVPIGSIVRGGGIHIGRGFFASGVAWIEAVTEYEGQRFTPTLRLGDNVRASPRLHISAIHEVVIGDWCLFGENVFIADHQHGATSGEAQTGPDVPPALRPLGGAGSIQIGERCHLGNNVVVLPGARVGSGCIIGANSVVSGAIPDNSIAVGAPARVVKQWDAAAGAWVRSG